MQVRARTELVAPDPDDDVGDYLAQRLTWLTRCAFLLTRDGEAAQDLAQDAAAQAWATRKRVCAARDRDAYVARIMLNLLRSQRRRRRVTTVDAAAFLEQVAPVNDADPEDRVVVMAALDGLSDRQRTAVVLRYWADFDDQQIAEVLRCRPGTVRSLLSRALKGLRLVLEED
jgi:RNA polymerase sigma-70 factor (sigma-E family)